MTPGLELAKQLAEALHDLGRRAAVHRVRPEAAPQLPHQRGGVEAPAGHVADGHAEPPARQREGVVPVTTEPGLGRREVAALEPHPQNVRQHREQAPLQGVREPALALGQAAMDRQRGAVAGAPQQVHVVVRELALLERADVQDPQHVALDDQRHPEQRPAGPSRAAAGSRSPRAPGPRSAPPGACRPPSRRSPFRRGCARVALHLLLEPLRRARDERPAVVLEQQDRRGVRRRGSPPRARAARRAAPSSGRYESAASVTLFRSRSLSSPSPVAMPAILSYRCGSVPLRPRSRLGQSRA